MMHDKINKLLKLSWRTKGQKSENFIFIQICKQFNTENVSRNACSKKTNSLFFQSLLRLSHTSLHARSPLNYRACCKGMESKSGLIASICITWCNKQTKRRQFEKGNQILKTRNWVRKPIKKKKPPSMNATTATWQPQLLPWKYTVDTHSHSLQSPYNNNNKTKQTWLSIESDAFSKVQISKSNTSHET